MMSTQTLSTGLLCIVGIAGMRGFAEQADAFREPAQQLHTQVGNSKGDSGELGATNSVNVAVLAEMQESVQGTKASEDGRLAKKSRASSQPRFTSYPSNASAKEIWMHGLMDKPGPTLKFEKTTSLTNILDQIAEFANKEYGADAGEQFRLTIVPDFWELESVDIESLDDVQVREFKCSGGRIRSMLNLIFSQTDPSLTWIIKNDVMLVTSEELRQMSFSTRVYDVGHISKMQFVGDQLISYEGCLGGWSGGRQRSVAKPTAAKFKNSEEAPESQGKTDAKESDSEGLPGKLTLVDLVQMMVSPDTWSSEGADPGGHVMLSANKLIVRQTRSAHEEIVELLNALSDGAQTQ